MTGLGVAGFGPRLPEMAMEGLYMTRRGIPGAGMGGLGMDGLDAAVEVQADHFWIDLNAQGMAGQYVDEPGAARIIIAGLVRAQGYMRTGELYALEVVNTDIPK